MAVTKSRPLTRQDFAEAAEEYASRLTLEDIMEATPQAAQREITLESLALVKARRPDVHVFNELLVQYKQPGSGKIGQVVPDNMIVVSTEPIRADGSFDLPFEAAVPFCVMEYVSPNTERKDHVVNMVKYERELKVPYYLLFDPRRQQVTLFRHNKRKFVAVKPNEQGRLAMTEIDLEICLLAGWVRYWYQGELLPLPADLQRDLDQARQKLAETVKLLDQERQARQAADEEIARLKALLEQTRRPRRNGS